MEPDELVESLRPLLPGALVATDFDGTLAPLTLDPQQSRPAAGAIEALTALTTCGARIAVVTGRDARTVVRLGGLDDVPGLVVAGLYGIETWSGGELRSPETPAVIETLRAELPAALDAAGVDPDVWVEDKRLSLVVHARRTADPAAALADVRAAVDAVAMRLDLEVHPGSDVLELRLPGYDKGSVLERLVAEHAPGAVLYLGDDLGDLPAFAATRRLRGAGTPAWSVAVGSPGVDAVIEAGDVHVPDPASAIALLMALTR